MSYQLLLLGILADQPRHGYEIKQHLEEGTFGDYVKKISGGGLYYNLHKLVKDGYVIEQTVEREGNYPERQVYEITEDGRKHLYQLVCDTLSDFNGRRFFDPIDAALLFSTRLPREAVIIRLQRHIDRLKGKLLEIGLVHSGLCSIQGKVLNEPYMLLLLDHSIARLTSDMEWLISAQEKIKNDPAFEVAHHEKPSVNTFMQRELPEDDRNRENQKTYMEYDDQSQKALGRYVRQLDLAWNEYEISEKLFINSKDNLKAAHVEYDRKVQAAWEKYQATTGTVATAREEFINKALAENSAV